MGYGDYLRNSSVPSDSELKFFEDTHAPVPLQRTGGQAAPVQQIRYEQPQPQTVAPSMQQPYAAYSPPVQQTAPVQQQQMPAAPLQQQTPQTPQNYGFPRAKNGGSVVVYEPYTPEDVEILINYLRTKQQAIVRLVKQDPVVAQRILDMVSGAVFALKGQMITIADNIFLLTPEGVQISTPL